ncbi:hypothetical protein WDJ51_00865 [Rathayibacter sp. YIM 133350]|uniref:hypothetical protein n=1 Tax=Rathayibacter sp. YIM 133350 TaxID=3131992 RepID=UPI00307DB930
MTTVAEKHAKEAQSTVTDGAFEPAFRELLASVRVGAYDREKNRTLLHAEVAQLRELGFTRLRLPRGRGGAGLGFEELFSRLIDLSAADSSLGHLYRGHIAFVEGVLIEGIDEPDAAVWVERIARGDLVGNAQSERQETAAITTRLDREDGVIRLTGTKYYTTGSIYADWIHLSALDGDERVAVTVRTAVAGVRSVDDWDGFGQLLTGSGTTTFEQVLVDPADIRRSGDDPGHWQYIAAVFQLSLLAVVAGIAQRALEDTVDFVRPRRRIFGFPGETPPRDDELTQSIVGRLSSVAYGARALVLGAARELEALQGRLLDGSAAQGEQQAAMLDVFRVQQLVLPLVLDGLTELFEVGGASAVSRTIGLDRHWRNARTIASHNPAIQRCRALGQFELNGTLPDWKAPSK